MSCCSPLSPWHKEAARFATLPSTRSVLSVDASFSICVSSNLVHCNLGKTFRISAVVLQNVMLGCSVAEYEQHM